MDIIYISQLRVETVIGVYEWERHIRQVVLLDLEMATDVARAAATDNIADALNYKAVAKRVAAFVEGTRFQLVETLAERVAERVLDDERSATDPLLADLMTKAELLAAGEWMEKS